MKKYFIIEKTTRRQGKAGRVSKNSTPAVSCSRLPVVLKEKKEIKVDSTVILIHSILYRHYFYNMTFTAQQDVIFSIKKQLTMSITNR